MLHRFSKKQAHEQKLEQTAQTQSGTTPEFESVEEMLRYDAARVSPPPAVAERLRDSLAREKPKAWWQRWFSPHEPDDTL